MKKYSVILAVLLLAASCGKSDVKPISVPTVSPTPTTINQPAVKSYISPTEYGFTLEYSNDFGFSIDPEQVKGLSYIPVCDDNMLACVYLKKETYPGTNFDGAGVSVNIYPDINTDKKCYQLINPTSSVNTVQPDVTINGVIFKHGTGGDAATGHSEAIKIYRNLHNNQCYEIAAHVAETNISLYEPGTIKEFDQVVVWDKLQTVVNSFKFSNSIVSAGKMQVCPDEWWQNDMPAIDSQKPAKDRQYYILNGQRRELGEFDTNWVSKNCKVELMHAY